MSTTLNFCDVMRLKEPPPERMPLMDPGPDAGAAWQRAIKAEQSELGFSNTQEAARQCMSQPFGSAKEMNPLVMTRQA